MPAQAGDDQLQLISATQLASIYHLLHSFLFTPQSRVLLNWPYSGAWLDCARMWAGLVAIVQPHTEAMGNGSSAALEADPPAAKTTVSFQLNGEALSVRDASPLLSLNDWLRSQPGLAGTKRMCEEGGCGCCVVAVATGSSRLQKIGTTDDDWWDCMLPEKASTIAINSVRNKCFSGGIKVTFVLV